MIVRPFADTNLAVYGLDADPARRVKMLLVMRARPVISVQLFSEDLQHGQVFNRQLTVVNPFHS